MKYNYYVMVIKNGKAEHWYGIPYETKKKAEIAALRAKVKEEYVVIERRLRQMNTIDKVILLRVPEQWLDDRKAELAHHPLYGSLSEYLVNMVDCGVAAMRKEANNEKDTNTI